ncbi:MAG: transcriptional regulator [Flavobacterium sp.]|nr:transcriptional regulator [Flavobacterium sp.]OGV08674.1 MAG: hypothetical protein A2299_16260 [Stygiobacter sp. RIFOXYB2_FULL_37_11]OGV13461.1 MAG: hypothetical protein A2237_16955 [Stygiobacter sp. RIFOXYA2_FULL_38_8]OGV14752.1 MAG: hypothetical protein A2440_09640 [Stygiobacter sp. RIFOXYC2_FULL_38_25]OGV22288.1 MAG: hypothetical protein A2499_04890 [Stygiobacter sp. RIFOXYC12_FULL_38_8]OGV79245.1 MAG: hypothetical protein A2X65_02010 [Stygiobacter sp. GWF2_38_21]
MSKALDKKLIKISVLAERIGISQSYASEIVNGIKTGPKAQKWLKKMIEESKRTTSHLAA